MSEKPAPAMSAATDGGDDKRPMQSKKFIAYLVAELTWKAIVVLLIFVGREAMPKSLFFLLLAVVLIAGFIEVGYILSTNALDKYTRLAQIAVNANGKINGTTGKVVSKGTKGLIDLHPEPSAEEKDLTGSEEPPEKDEEKAP